MFSGHCHVCAQTTHGRGAISLGIQGSGAFSPRGSHDEAAMPQIPNDMGIQASQCAVQQTSHEYPVLYYPYSHFYSLAGLQLHQQLLPKAVKLAALEHCQCVSEPKHGWAIKEIEVPTVQSPRWAGSIVYINTPR